MRIQDEGYDIDNLEDLNEVGDSDSSVSEKSEYAPEKILQCHVIDGKLFRDTELIGEMDPFVKFELDGKKYKTNIIDEGGKNPRWD